MTANKTLGSFQFGELNPLSPSENKSLSDSIDTERMSPIGVIGKTVEKIVERDIFKGVGYFKAIVLRKEDDYEDVGFIGRILGDTSVIRFKARIPEIHASLPIPLDVERGKIEENEIDEKRILNNKIIDMYPTFEANGTNALTHPPVGSIVFVDFANRETFGDPIFIGPVNEKDQTIAGADTNRAREGESSAAFNDKKSGRMKNNSHLPNNDLSMNEPPKRKVLPFAVDRAKYGANKGKAGNHQIKVREDMIAPLENIKKHLHELGTVLVSVGGIRPLSMSPSPGGGAIATSLHYPALALDLWPKTGCHDDGNPWREQYVIQFDPKDKSAKPKFIVWARSDKNGAASQGPNGIYTAEKMRIPVLDIRGRSGIKPKIRRVEGVFVNLTQIFLDYGFTRISGRPTFYTESIEGHGEWWHFEYHPEDLQIGTKYGEILEKIYKPPREGSDGLPWSKTNRRKVWTGSAFVDNGSGKKA